MTATRWLSGLQFALWAAVGAGGELGVLTAPTIGLFVLPVTAAVAATLAWRRHVGLAGPAILSGLGLLPGYIAYLNRGGPGTVCTATATGGTCSQQWSPWPWLGVGLCFVVAGTALQVRTSLRQACQHDEAHGKA